MPHNASQFSQPMVEASPMPAALCKTSWAGLAKKAFASVILGLLVYLAVFRLPFLFPPQVRLMSASYTFGFNNSVAIFALVALLGLATLLQVLRQQTNEPLITFAPPGAAGTRRSLRVAFVGLVLLYTLITWALYLYDKQSEPSLMWETRHLLYRTWIMDAYKLRPYTEVAAEYGPLLTYAPLLVYWLLKPLGASHLQAYFVCHLILNVGGLWCAYYIFSRAMAPSFARAIAFVVIAVSGFGPWMGINGVLLRYLFPFASLLLGHSVVRWVVSLPKPQLRWSVSAATVVLLSSANILVSPEVGLAFALAWTAYAILSVRFDIQILAVSFIGLFASALLCWLFLPAAYYGAVLRFSEGANNLPLLPAAHLLFYIFSLFLVVPRLLAGNLRQPPGSDRSGLAITGALGALCVFMAPGALGRCDPPHVLFYGMGLVILATIALANISLRAFAVYVAAYAGVFIVLMQLVNLRVFYGISPLSLLTHPISSVAKALPSTVGTEHPSLATLSALDRYPRLGLPYASFGDPEVERYVLSRGQLHPEYYVSIVGVYNAAALEHKLSDVSKMEYLLVPNRFISRYTRNLCKDYVDGLRRWFFYPARLPCRFDALDPEGSLNRFIADNYVTVEQIGSWSVLQRTHGSPQQSAISP